MKKLGLIGFPLSHSFSAQYFKNKFETEKIEGYQYNAYPLNDISQLEELLRTNPELIGLNVTIPYKEQVIPYLDSMDEKAKEIGAVNVIKIKGKKLIGFNSDYHGFKRSLLNFISEKHSPKALILGTGGASKAIKTVLTDISIPFKVVSRGDQADYQYNQLTENIYKEHKLIINCTPLGTHPEVQLKPDINYDFLDETYYLYDLVYNPETTAFMKAGLERGAQVKNGYEMLKEQAEVSWEIWTS